MAKIICALIVVVAVKCSSGLTETHRIAGFIAIAKRGIITGSALDCVHAIHTAGVDGIAFLWGFNVSVATDGRRGRRGTRTQTWTGNLISAVTNSTVTSLVTDSVTSELKCALTNANETLSKRL